MMTTWYFWRAGFGIWNSSLWNFWNINTALKTHDFSVALSQVHTHTHTHSLTTYLVIQDLKKQKQRFAGCTLKPAPHFHRLGGCLETSVLTYRLSGQDKKGPQHFCHRTERVTSLCGSLWARGQCFCTSDPFKRLWHCLELRVNPVCPGKHGRERGESERRKEGGERSERGKSEGGKKTGGERKGGEERRGEERREDRRTE